MNKNIEKMLEKNSKQEKQSYSNWVKEKFSKNEYYNSSSLNSNEINIENSKKKKRLFWLLGSLSVLLIGLSVSLPLLLTSKVNAVLSTSTTITEAESKPVSKTAIDIFNSKPLAEKMSLYNNSISTNLQQKIWDIWFSDNTIDPTKSIFYNFLLSFASKDTPLYVPSFALDFTNRALKDCYINNPSRINFRNAFLKFVKPSLILRIEDTITLAPSTTVYSVFSYDIDNLVNLTIKENITPSGSQNLSLEVKLDQTQLTFFSFGSGSNYKYFYYNQVTNLSDEILGSGFLFSNSLKALVSSLE